jgi:hypothetical protein
LPARSRWLLAAQGGFQAFFDEALADPLHRGHADVHRLDDALVGPGGATGGGIGLQQNAGVGQLPGSCLARSDQVLELLAFLLGQRNFVPLHHLSPGVSLPPGELIQLHPSVQMR